MKIHRKRGRRRRETHTQESAARQTQTAALQPCDVWSPAHPLSSRGPQFTCTNSQQKLPKDATIFEKKPQESAGLEALSDSGKGNHCFNRKKFPAGPGLAFKR